MRAVDANGVICDDELSPAQMNNLERELDCKVMDRTLLILDIFADRAVTSEGKIQVELAQLPVSRSQTGRTSGISFQTGWWYRYQGPWRKETGNGQTSDPQPYFCIEGRTCAGGEAQRPDPGETCQR